MLDPKGVSIRARSNERAIRFPFFVFVFVILVSIRARSNERAIQNRASNPAFANRFQSAPAQMSGRYHAATGQTSIQTTFQSAPAQMSGRYLRNPHHGR